jgi:hypothetical protein
MFVEMQIEFCFQRPAGPECSILFVTNPSGKNRHPDNLRIKWIPASAGMTHALSRKNGHPDSTNIRHFYKHVGPLGLRNNKDRTFLVYKHVGPQGLRNNRIEYF